MNLNPLKVVTHDDKKESFQSWEAWMEGEINEQGVESPVGYGATEEEAKGSLRARILSEIQKYQEMLNLLQP